MVKVFGFKFFEPEPVKSFWREFLDAIPKVSRPPVKEPVKIDKKLLIAVGVGVSMCLAIRYRNKLRSLLPGYQRLKTALGCEPPLVVSGIAYNDRRVCYESVRSGSVETAQLKPKCQVYVGELKAGEFHAVGSAVRMRDYLVMPCHVFASVEEPCIKGTQHWIKMDKDRDYLDLDTDLIAFKMTEKELSTIGVAQATISHTLPHSGEFVSVVGLQNKGTTGTLRHDRMVFGRVIYDGTTVAGYSGSGYCSGNRLVGVHTNGGSVNGGFSASYVYSLICYKDRVKDEDSEDWLRSVHKRNKNRFRVDKRWGDLDDVRIEANGRYAVVSRSSMAAAFGNQWMEEFDDIDPTHGLVDYHYAEESVVKPSGEAKDSNAGVSSINTKTSDQSLDEQSDLIEMLQGLSKKKRMAIITVLKQSVQNSSTLASAVAPAGRKNTEV